jgi:hypothetical protein
MGTPEYMCPEMIMTKSRDQKSAGKLSYSNSCDWWACGVLLYVSKFGILLGFATMKAIMSLMIHQINRILCFCDR